jgi:aminopeptidase-like protein
MTREKRGARAKRTQNQPPASPGVWSPPAGLGEEMYGWAERLFPICRSLTGLGVRKSLDFLRGILPALQVHEVPSGTRAFDWTVPDEWNIRDAYVMDEAGHRVIDFRKSNLHVVGYSEPVDAVLSLEELNKHLYSLEDQPDAIPYITCYYQRRWGFCLSHRKRLKLKPGRYRAFIDSTLRPGSMTYGELLLPGAEQKEIFFSTYICHPSMANNELSGPVVAAALARALCNQPDRRFSYRFVFVPETIGSIVYLSRNLLEMQRNIIAGFVLTCCGDDRMWSMLESRSADTLADRVARNILRHTVKDFKTWTFLDRGSDERQYCSAGVDLPVASIMRSKYGTYPEYHTSLDDLDMISPSALAESYAALRLAASILEGNRRYATTVLCEPQLGRRILLPTLSTKVQKRQDRMLRDFNAYCDGSRDIIGIADRIGARADELIPLAEMLSKHGLLRRVD